MPARVPADRNQPLAAAAPAPAEPARVPIAQISRGSSIEGRLLFVKDGNLWTWENGGAFERSGGGTWRQPRWAPDGSKFAFVYRGTSFSDLFVTRPDGSDQTRLTASQSQILDENRWNFRPTWSPDGRRIAFVSDRPSPAQASIFPNLWIMNADGSGARPVATPGVQQEVVDELSWSPDGTRLAAAIIAGPGTQQIAVVPVGTSGAARLITAHANGALDPAWAPAGGWIAYAAREGRDVDVYAAREDGSGPVRLTTTGLARAPAWSPDGRRLAYLSAETGAFEVWVADVQATGSSIELRNPRQLTRDLGLDAPSGISWGR